MKKRKGVTQTDLTKKTGITPSNAAAGIQSSAKRKRTLAPGNASKDNTPTRVDVDWEDSKRLFNFLFQADPMLIGALGCIDSKATQQGGLVKSNTGMGAVLGNMFTVAVLEHPVQDLNMVRQYWRVMGMCPYLVIQNEQRTFIRIPDPSISQMSIKVETGAHGTLVYLHSTVGYENPRDTKKKDDDGRGSGSYEDPSSDVMRYGTRRAYGTVAYRANGHKPVEAKAPSNQFGEAGENGKKPTRKRRSRDGRFEDILDSGVYLWRDRPLPSQSNGGKVVTELRSLYTHWTTLQLAKVLHLNTQRSLSRVTVITGVDEARFKPSGTTNMRGGVPGEQISVRALMAEDLPQEGEDVGASADINPEDLSETEWKATLSTHFTGIAPGCKVSPQEVPTVTSVPPRKMDIGEKKTYGVVSASSILQLEALQNAYRVSVAAYTGKNMSSETGTKTTALDSAMELETEACIVQRVQSAMANFFEHAYAVVMRDQELQQVVDSIMEEKREATTIEQELFLSGEFIKVEFQNLTKIEDTSKIIEAIDMGSITEEEGLVMYRLMIGMPINQDTPKLKLNRLVLPSELERRKLLLQEKALRSREQSTSSTEAKVPEKPQDAAEKANSSGKK